MQDKVADNKIYNTKTKLSNLDDEIDSNKKILKEFNDVQDNTRSLQKNLNKCLELLNYSIRGKNVNRMLTDLKDRNMHNCAKSIKSVDEQIAFYQKKISKLNEEKENLIEEMRREKNKE